MKRRQQVPRSLVGSGRCPRCGGSGSMAADPSAPGRPSPKSFAIRDPRRLSGALAGRRPGRDTAPAEHGNPRRQPLPRHTLQLLRPELRVAEVHRLLHEEGRRRLLGRHREPALPGGDLDGHGSRLDRAGRAHPAGPPPRRARRALRSFYRNDGIEYTTRRPGEVLAEVLLDPSGDWRSTYWKLRRRGAFDFPVLSVAAAARLSDGKHGRTGACGAGCGGLVPGGGGRRRVVPDRPSDSRTTSSPKRRAWPAGPAKPMDNTGLRAPLAQAVGRGRWSPTPCGRSGATT